jgi:hypothetical protein
MFLISERLMKFLLVSLLMLGLVGCSSTNLVLCEDGREPLWFSTPSKSLLKKGSISYEQGNYAVAMTRLQGVLDLPEATSAEKIEAYKLMAFIHCISGREKMGGDSFKKALQLDPKFDLTPAEVGHPVWGPVFRAAKKVSAN